jgi:hypothetical protein
MEHLKGEGKLKKNELIRLVDDMNKIFSLIFRKRKQFAIHRRPTDHCRGHSRSVLRSIEDIGGGRQPRKHQVPISWGFRGLRFLFDRSVIVVIQFED